MAATDGVQRFAVLAIAVAAASAVTVLTGFGAGGPADSSLPASFRLEDGSAACARLESGALACRARGGDAAVVLEPDGAPPRGRRSALGRLDAGTARRRELVGRRRPLPQRGGRSLVRA
jgi:hypothetical protein